MPRAARTQSTLSGLVDSDSDDHLVETNAMPTPDSAAENKAPVKRGRAKAKAAAPAKATKTKVPARRASGKLETKAQTVTAPKGGRKALADKTNQQGGSDSEDVDDFAHDENDVEMEDAVEASVVAIKETKVKATRKAPAARGKAAREAAANIDDADEEEAPEAVPNTRTKQTKLPAKRQAAVPPSPEKVIMETQVPVIDVEGDEEVIQPVSRTAQSAARRRSVSRARATSVQRRRAGSASDTERSDPAMRRKLGEITKKYENLNVKYQDLREIGLKEAERNFERLRKQTEEKTAGKSTYCNERF